MRTKLGFILLVILMVIAACGGNDEAQSGLSEDRSNNVVESDAGGNAPAPSVPNANGVDAPVNQPSTIVNQERLIIQNATLNLMVEDVAAKITDIRDIAAQHDGWVVSSNSSTRIAYDDVTYGYGSISIRVPADQFDNVLATIKVIGVIQVKSENITGEDVTERYVDLNSRLSSKQTSYNQLSELMDSATNVEEVLAVQSELERFQTEIEVLEGQIRYLEESAAYSLITIEMSEEIPQQPDDDEEEESWKPVQTAEDAFDALVALLQWLVDVLIVVAVFVLPLAVIVGLPSWGIYKVVRPYLPSDKPTSMSSTNFPSDQAQHDEE